MRSAEGRSAPKQTRIAGFSADGQMRGKSAQATDSRSRAPAGTAKAAAPSVIATRSAPSRTGPSATAGSSRRQPVVISVDRPSGPTMASRTASCAAAAPASWTR
jgi:hypothetical protein